MRDLTGSRLHWLRESRGNIVLQVSVTMPDYFFIIYHRMYAFVDWRSKNVQLSNHI